MVTLSFSMWASVLGEDSLFASRLLSKETLIFVASGANEAMSIRADPVQLPVPESPGSSKGSEGEMIP
jgi:hypothetical protein